MHIVTDRPLPAPRNKSVYGFKDLNHGNAALFPNKDAVNTMRSSLGAYNKKALKKWSTLTEIDPDGNGIWVYFVEKSAA